MLFFTHLFIHFPLPVFRSSSSSFSLVFFSLFRRFYIFSCSFLCFSSFLYYYFFFPSSVFSLISLHDSSLPVFHLFPVLFPVFSLLFTFSSPPHNKTIRAWVIFFYPPLRFVTRIKINDKRMFLVVLIIVSPFLFFPLVVFLLHLFFFNFASLMSLLFSHHTAFLLFFCLSFHHHWVLINISLFFMYIDVLFL